MDGEPGRAQEGRHALQGERRGAVGLFDDGADPFAALGVGEADDGGVDDGRVSVEQVLGLLGRDVLAFADDDVLLPSGEDEVPAGSGGRGRR
ncbi:hypothetical protein GCM10010282_36060 [Streptomyces roseolus]|nr:hypothetical protein GCM10010282_36060 [Streptomyces roseolus]